MQNGEGRSEVHSKSDYINYLMWNSPKPYFPEYFPFYNHGWSFYAPSYPVNYPLPLIQEEKTEKPPIAHPVKSQPAKTSEEIEIKTFNSIDTKNEKKRHVKTPPVRRRKREDSFDQKQQKRDRNIPSNICKLFISFLYQHSCPLRAMRIQNEKQQEILSSCIQQVRQFILEKQTYVRPEIVEGMCQGQLLSPRESACFRTFFKRFMRVELRMTVVMMRRLRKKEKIAYFKVANKFLKTFMKPR